MRRISRFALLLGGLAALACSGMGEEEEVPPVPEPPVPPPVEPTPPPAASALPFEFPAVALTARPGEFVLVPSEDPLNKARAGDSATFVYYGATLTEVGPTESKVRSLAGQEYTMPNALIIPIPPAQQAQKGDVVLGHWESGSGLQRAIVTGGTPTAPTVRYLDMDYDNPSGWGQKEDTFQADRFLKLTAPWQVGTTVACAAESGDREHGILTAVSGDRLLVLGFAGTLKARDRAECVGLAPMATVAVGQNVWVPAVGRYVQGTVTRVDADAGRATVSYEWGGVKKETAFSLADITTDLAASPTEQAPPKGDDHDDVPDEPSTTTPKTGKGKVGKGKVGKGKVGEGKLGKGKAGKGTTGDGAGGTGEGQ